MKINVFMSVAALIIGTLVFYWFDTMYNHLFVAILGSIVCCIFLIPALAVRIRGCPFSTFLFKIIAGLTFVVLLTTTYAGSEVVITNTTFTVMTVVATALGCTGMRAIYTSEL